MDSASVHPLPSRDPVSGGRLVITELEGPETGITIRGRFEMPRFAELSPEQSKYLETFLRCRGMLNSVERELGISYPTARARLDAVLRALDLHEVREDNGTGSEAPVEEPAAFDVPVEEAPIETPILEESDEPITIETIFDEPIAPFEPIVGEPPAIEEAEWQATAPEGTVFENAAFDVPSESAAVEDAAVEEEVVPQEDTEPRRSRDEILTLLERGEITPDEAKRELAK